MPLFAKSHRLKWSWQLLIFYCLSVSVFAQPTIRQASTRLVGNTYLLNASIEYEFNSTLTEALHSGIGLSFIVDFEINRERELWWDETVSRFSRHYQLRYHALSRQYLLRYGGVGSTQSTFPTLGSALNAMGILSDIPVIKKIMVKMNNAYKVSFQVSLDVESLPVPLRTVAYLSSDWHFRSDWYTCPLSTQK